MTTDHDGARRRRQDREDAKITRCGWCGAWQYAGACTTPHEDTAASSPRVRTDGRRMPA